MGTIVLLTAFLLAASANPLDNSSGTPEGDIFVSDGENGPRSPPLTDGVSATSTERNTTNRTEEATPPNDFLTIPPRDNVNNSLGDSNYPENNENNNIGDANHPEDNGNDNIGDENHHEDSVNNNNTEDALNSSTVAISTTSTKPPIMWPASTDSETYEKTPNNRIELDPLNGSENVTEPPDADPSDCKNATVPGHVYLLCTYSCGGDEMLVAMNNTRCYLNQTHAATIDLPKSGVHIQVEATETGVCIDGECVPGAPTEAPTSTSSTVAPTTISPTDTPASISSTETPASISPSETPTSASSDLLEQSTNRSEPGPVS